MAYRVSWKFCPCPLLKSDPRFYLPGILGFYFTQILVYPEAAATREISNWQTVTYFTPLLGAIIADSYLGKFRTILILSIVYALGQIALTLAAVGDTPEGIHGMPVT